MSVSRHHFMPLFGKSDAIMVEPSQLQRLHFIDKRLFTPNMELSSLLLAILIQNVMHCRSGGRPIFRGHVAEYTVEIMRRKRTDVIDVGMICIPDAAKLWVVA